MNTTKKQTPILVQMYDKEVVREFRKIFKGFFFRSEEIVRTETIKNELVLDIKSERVPDKIFFNGVLMFLPPLHAKE